MCWHKWKYVKEDRIMSFEGVIYKESHNKYRICQKCGKAQKKGVNWWVTLSQEATEILKTLVVDKGDYYIMQPYPKIGGGKIK